VLCTEPSAFPFQYPVSLTRFLFQGSFLDLGIVVTLTESSPGNLNISFSTFSDVPFANYLDSTINNLQIVEDIVVANGLTSHWYVELVCRCVGHMEWASVYVTPLHTALHCTAPYCTCRAGLYYIVLYANLARSPRNAQYSVGAMHS
jgi:hypothetical protein